MLVTPKRSRENENINITPPNKKIPSENGGSFTDMGGVAGFTSNPSSSMSSGVQFPNQIGTNLLNSFNLFSRDINKRPMIGSGSKSDVEVTSQSKIRPWGGLNYEKYIDTGDLLFELDMNLFDDDKRFDVIVNTPQFTRIMYRQSKEARDTVLQFVKGRMKYKDNNKSFQKYVMEGRDPIINIQELECLWRNRDIKTRKDVRDDYNEFMSNMRKLEKQQSMKLKELIKSDDGFEGDSEVFKKFKENVTDEYIDILDKFKDDRDISHVKSLNILDNYATDILMYLSPSLIKRHWSIAGIAKERENTGAFGQGYIPSDQLGTSTSITRYGKTKMLNIFQSNLKVNDNFNMYLTIQYDKNGSFIKPIFDVTSYEMDSYNIDPYELNYVDPLTKQYISRTVYPSINDKYYIGYVQTPPTGNINKKVGDYEVAKGYIYNESIEKAYQVRKVLSTATIIVKQKS